MIKPMRFSTEMVQAILEDLKTVTRRVVKPQPTGANSVIGQDDDDRSFDLLCGNGAEDGVFRYWAETIKAPCWVGDILWVRETWNCLPIPEPLRGTSKTYWYKADGAEPEDKWRPSIHMPREAARIFLRVTDVRVERLRDMTRDDVFMEGVFPTSSCENIWDRWSFVWDRTFKPVDRPTYGWKANPWVWVIEFDRISKEDLHEEPDYRAARNAV